MKRQLMIQHIFQAATSQGVAWAFARRGANHDIYRLDDLIIPIPRHREIGERLVETIFKECEPRLGERWWK